MTKIPATMRTTRSMVIKGLQIIVMTTVVVGLKSRKCVPRRSGRGAEDVAHHADKLQRAVVRYLVVDAIGVLAGKKNAFVAQDGQMVGDVALGGSHTFHDVLHTQFLLAKGAKDLEAQGVGHSFKRTRGTIDILVAGNEAHIFGFDHTKIP